MPILQAIFEFFQGGVKHNASFPSEPGFKLCTNLVKKRVKELSMLQPIKRANSQEKATIE